MVAALIPLAAAAIPALINAFKGPTPTPAAAPAGAAAPPLAPVVINSPQPSQPSYALTTSGQMVQLPAQQQAALYQLSQQQAMQPVQDHAALVGRAQVRHTQAALDPQLEQIRRQLDQRALQVQATAEHRRINAQNEFRKQVTSRLGTIERLARVPRY